MAVDRFDFGGLIFNMTYEFSKVQRAVSRRAGLYSGQPRVLTMLQKHEGCTLSELSDYCGIGMASLSVSIRNLEKSGLIRKENHGNDGRIQKLYLTDAGELKAMAFHREIDAFYEGLLDSMSGEEAVAAEKTLKQIIDFCIGYNGPDEM